MRAKIVLKLAISDLFTSNFNLGLWAERLAVVTREAPQADAEIKIPDHQVVTIFQCVELIRTTAKKAGLIASSAHANRILESHQRFRHFGQGIWLLNISDADHLKNELNMLSQMLGDELDHAAVVLIHQKNVKFFEQTEPLFGKTVDEKLSSARHDIQEAGKCLALSLGTACVMHLMRAVEAGLKALSKQLELPDQNDWGSHLRQIEKELEIRAKKAKARSTEEIFYSEAAIQLAHVKTAWRNPTMHIDRTYTVEEAEDIFQAVKILMTNLATRM